MAGKLVAKCIMQGICLCVSYHYDNKDDVCLGVQPSYRQFATRTDYNVAIQPHLEETTVPINVPDGCHPTLFYLFQRHTIRYPSARYIERGLSALPEVQHKLQEKRKKSKMCDADIDRIGSWVNTFAYENENDVTDSGKRATRLQVSRLRRRFPAVFIQSRSPLENMVVDYSEKGGRTKNTAEPFLREWFGDTVFENEIEGTGKLSDLENPLNTFHEECEAIMERHGINVTSENEEKLLKSEVYKKFKKAIEARLGFDIKKRDIKAMLNYCRFEMAAYGSSPWCAVFGEAEHRFAELLDDVEDFDVDAYGTPRNEMMACPVAVDLLNHIGNLTETDSKLPRAVLHFSHAGAFKKIAALLGLGRASGPVENCDNRSWFSSRQSPFNANFNVVHYSCPSGQENRVAVLFNEKMEHLSGCKEKLCTVGELERILRPKADKCDFNEICSK